MSRHLFFLHSSFPFVFTNFSRLFRCYFQHLTFSCIFPLFPPYFHLISRLFPKSHFPLHFSMVFTLFPPYFYVISKLFRGYFQNLTVCHYFPCFSPYYFHPISRLFPKSNFSSFFHGVHLFPAYFEICSTCVPINLFVFHQTTKTSKRSNKCVEGWKPWT